MIPATDKPSLWCLSIHGEFALRWRFTGMSRAVIDWEVHPVAGEDEQGFVFGDERHTCSDEAFTDPKHEPIEGGHLLNGFTCFDGCYNFEQTRKDCMIHVCDSGALLEVFRELHGLGEVFLDVLGSGWT